MALFSHRDGSDDSMEILEHTPHNALRMWARGDDGDTVNVVLPRSEVLSLIQALTEWAYPTHTPEGPNRSLIEELIAKAVKDQVAAVLPLHLSPVADGRCTALLQPGERLMGTHDACGMLWVTHRPAYPLPPVAEHRPQECPGAGQCPEADPEPGDVGHPRPPAAEDGPCADCGHSKDRHRPVCASWRESALGAGQTICRCNAYKAPAAEVTPPETCRCGHAKDRHRPHCAVVMRDDHGVICRCDGFGPSLPVRSPERVEIHRHECGLCKQPWSDGHGQPGDPCPGVEEARQHPGDWTDALWRVQPSAPTSEARYCDGCGHSWESHWTDAAKCMATKGKSVCGCTRRPE